uniref:Uncharacterized protein n=1 Tax=Picea glauca TaxID=3330 RepID=A0A101M067_PICGL|nr:hypothetical protein ABT39_MTgene4595 [Picea glauca]
MLTLELALHWDLLLKLLLLVLLAPLLLVHGYMVQGQKMKPQLLTLSLTMMSFLLPMLPTKLPYASITA